MPGSFLPSINGYLIRDSDGYALVDCGLNSEASWTALTDALEDLGAPMEAIHTIVVTHGHLDHSGLAARIRERSGGRVWLHENDWAYAQQRYLVAEPYRNLWRRWLQRYGAPEDEASEITRSLAQRQDHVRALAPDRLLTGGEVLEVGPYRFEVMWTPGHTPGHVCLHDPARRLFLSGDHVLPNTSSNVSLQPFAARNLLPGYLDSLRHIAGLSIDLGLPGHGDPMPSIQRRATQLLKHQLGRRERLLGLLTSRPQTPYDLAGQIWADSTPSNWSQFSGQLRRNAMGTLIAHLECLADDGLIVRHQDGAVAFTSCAQPQSA